MCDSIPSIIAVYPDGTAAELEAGLPKPENISGEQWWSVLYVPASPDTPSLRAAEKVIMNGEEISFDLLSTDELTDITEATGMVLEFTDMTAEILSVDYDGHFLRVIYTADYNGKPYNPERDNYLGVYEYQSTLKRHWFNSTAKIPELGDNVYMVTYELELAPGETTDRLAFEYCPTDQPYDESTLQRTGFYKVTGIGDDMHPEKYYAAPTDTGDIKGIVISPLGAYVLDETGKAYFHAADSLIFSFKDGTTEDFTIANGLSMVEYYTDEPDHDTEAKFSYVMNALGLSDTSPVGLAITTMIWPDHDYINVDNISAVILDGTIITNNIYLSQIAGIYGPGEEPYEVVESEETTENTTVADLPEFPIAIDNGNGFYGEYLETPLTGEEAWELVKERGGIDFDYDLPYDKSLFTYNGCEFCIEYADCDVTAFVGGTVEYSGWCSGYGLAVLIRDDNGHYWFWGHLSEVSAAEGDTVCAGDVIGHTGSTGYATNQRYAMSVG